MKSPIWRTLVTMVIFFVIVFAGAAYFSAITIIPVDITISGDITHPSSSILTVPLVIGGIIGGAALAIAQMAADRIVGK